MIVTKALEGINTKYDLLSQIGGGYQSYSYTPDSLPKESANHARFKMDFKSYTAIIYLECVMGKDKNGQWFLKNYKEDSLVKKR
jgi:hypothetical protein